MSVRPHGTAGLPLDGFSWNLVFEDFSKNLSRKFKFCQNLTRITDIHFWLYLAQLRHVCPSAWNSWAPTGRIFMKFGIWRFFQKFVEKIQVMSKSNKNNWYTSFIISRSVILRMRNVSDKSCTENQNTHFVFSDFIFENRAFYEIMWKTWYSGAGHRWQYGACALRVGYLRLQTYTQVV